MVSASSIEGDLKMTSEGMSSSAGGQFGSGRYCWRKGHGEQLSFEFD